MAQSDLALWRTGDGLTVAVKTGQHFGFFQLRKDFAGRCVQVQLAALHLLHGGSARQSFGHGRNPHNGVRCHRAVSPHLPGAEAAFVNRAAAVGGHGDHAGHFARIGGGFQQSICTGLKLALLGHGLRDTG